MITNVPYEDLKQLNARFMTAFNEKAKKVIESGWYILGEEVSTFEQAFAAYHNVDYCVGVASGLEALKLSLLALDFPAGSEVIVAANSYIATILAITQAGLTPILVEPKLQDGNIDVEQIAAAITPKTRAVLPIHMYGCPCDMGPLLACINEHELILIEDCAQAHGATYQGQKVGTFGKIGAFSFYPTKNLGALGDAGAIITNDKDCYEKILALRNYGESRKYQNCYQGFNARLDEIQAAFLNIKLQSLDTINTHKRALSKLYYEHLASELTLPPQYEDRTAVYHIFNIRHPARAQLMAALKREGVGTAIHYPTPPYRQRAYQGLLPTAFPISDEWHQTTLSLPISFGHSFDDISFVIKTIKKVMALSSYEVISN